MQALGDGKPVKISPMTLLNPWNAAWAKIKKAKECVTARGAACVLCRCDSRSCAGKLRCVLAGAAGAAAGGAGGLRALLQTHPPPRLARVWCRTVGDDHNLNGEGSIVGGIMVVKPEQGITYMHVEKDFFGNFPETQTIIADATAAAA